MGWAGHVALLVGIRKSHKTLIEKLEKTRSFGRLRRRRDDKITMDLQEVWCEDVELIQLTKDKSQWQALVPTVIKLCASYNFLIG
jgi:hypothetical protein